MHSIIDVRDGTHDTPSYVSEGYPLITGKDFYNGFFCLSKTQYVSASDYELIKQRSRVDVGDILFSMIGGNIGSQILITEDNYFEMAIKNVALFKQYGDHFIDSHYLSYFLQSRVQDFKAIAAGGAQSFVSLKQLRQYLIPVPCFGEQQRIVAKLKDLLPIVEHYDNSQIKLNKLNGEICQLLKKSILQEAIQGRLVEQDPNDEPASVLLEHIRTEKQRLVKEGKMKKSALQDSVIYRGDDNKYWEKRGNEIVCIDDEIPFDIPNSWTWCRIKDIFQINPKNNAQDDFDAAFIPMEKIDATYLSSFTYSTKKWGEIKKGFTHFADGDVAFAKITPCFQNRKSMILRKLPNGIGAGTTELKVLRSYGGTIVNEYLLFFLESSYFVDEATFKGTANQQRIISGYLENKLFPLPPFQEQQRIVNAVLSTWQVL